MTVSRKEFFRRSLYTLGDGLLRAGAAVREATDTLPAPPPPEIAGPCGPELDAPPAGGPHLVARVDNRHCLARSCGCFSCLDCCEAGAITLVPGQGVGIDAALCTGCGACQALCPLAPRALALVTRPIPEEVLSDDITLPTSRSTQGGGESMLKSRKRIRPVPLGLAVIALALAAAFLLVGPPQLLAVSDSPGFCAGCHVMEKEHTAFLHSGAHRRNRCVDCHLPNENLAAHYVWKSIDGLKDAVFFYSGRTPETIRLSGHGEKVLKANCVRCHEELVSMISTERNCWSCHRSLAHTRSGAIQTL